VNNNEFADIIGSPHPAPGEGYIVSCTYGDGISQMWIDRICIERGVQETRYTPDRRRARHFEKVWAERLRDGLFQPDARIERAS